MSQKIYQIAVLVGSLRKASYNRKVAMELIKLAPESLSLKIIEIGDLPFYNEDLETGNPPASWVSFREQIKSVDGLLFVTPEYNRSVPATIKNAIDVGSRPYGQNVWDGKPAAIASASMGGIAGFGANHHLRQSLVFINTPCMAQPEAYLGVIQNSFNEQGVLAESTAGFLREFMNSYAKWVQKINA